MSNLIKERVEKILKECHLISLAVSDENGPWASIVHFAADADMNIYWMSDPEALSTQASVKNNKAAGTITLSMKKGEKNLGIQLSGVAEKLEGERPDVAKIYFSKKGKPVPEDIADFMDGDSWYMIKPQ